MSILRIITTASYCGTGSSAVTDFFSEFNNCKSLGDYEFRFAQDPDGLSDLEYNIVENNHRLNTSEAIKRYKKLIYRLNGTWYAKEYEEYFGDDWLKLSEEYIERLTQLKSKAWWHQDQIDRGEVFRFIDRLVNKIYRTIKGYHGAGGKCISMLSKNELGYFTYITENQFLSITKDYTDALFTKANKDNMPFFVIDQLVPASNIARYNRYFKNMVVIIVDRDPRDIYLREKTAGWGIIPTTSVSDFCEWYCITREHRKHEEFESNVFYLQFEDLIYHYEETTNKLIKFVGISEDNHRDKFEHLNPNVSIKNTNLKYKYPDLSKDVKYIEENLSEYLYDF